MKEIIQIARPVIAEFDRFKRDFSNTLECENPLLKSAIEHVLRTNGKHVRPLLLLLSAKAFGNVTEITQKAALIFEILHTASLIHDDVVDETKQRRGVPSLNAIFDNRIAVLTGDYILAIAILKATEAGSLALIRIIAEVCRELSEGELTQLDNADKYSIDEDEYFVMIRKKTAALISACAEMGAISAGASADIAAKFRIFGEYLGYCFQIKDDIFDYYDDKNIGKPTKNDILEGKITLPLIYALKT
ncbi:MAG: polyprenyl synthetase family protein, partial [Tannerella sp.]|nr:polyprenyl synthetase family protein [Tannerella sp.]